MVFNISNNYTEAPHIQRKPQKKTQIYGDCPRCKKHKLLRFRAPYDLITRICRACYDVLKKEITKAKGQECPKCNKIVHEWRANPNNKLEKMCQKCAYRIWWDRKHPKPLPRETPPKKTKIEIMPPIDFPSTLAERQILPNERNYYLKEAHSDFLDLHKLDLHLPEESSGWVDF